MPPRHHQEVVVLIVLIVSMQQAKRQMNVTSHLQQINQVEQNNVKFLKQTRYFN